jgi:hypothetical protein
MKVQDDNEQFEQFRDELPGRLERLKRGEGIGLEDDSALEEVFDEIEAETAARATRHG